jgi:hypothetical protein
VPEAWINSFQFGSSSVSEGLKDISRVMMDWSKNILGDLEKRIKKLRKDLAKCIKGPLTQDNVKKEHVLRYRLGKLEDQKEIYWKQ